MISYIADAQVLVHGIKYETTRDLQSKWLTNLFLQNIQPILIKPT